MAVPASAWRTSRAWLFEVANGVRLAAGAPLVAEYLLEPETIPLARLPAHCRGVMLWRERIIPVIDLAPVISEAQGSSGAGSRAVVLAWQEAPGQPLQYGALSVRSAPVETFVSDSDARPLPERPRVLRHLAGACFGHEDEIIAILDVRRLFGRSLPWSPVDSDSEPVPIEDTDVSIFDGSEDVMPLSITAGAEPMGTGADHTTPAISGVEDTGTPMEAISADDSVADIQFDAVIEDSPVVSMGDGVKAGNFENSEGAETIAHDRMKAEGDEGVLSDAAIDIVESEVPLDTEAVDVDRAETVFTTPVFTRDSFLATDESVPPVLSAETETQLDILPPVVGVTDTEPRSFFDHYVPVRDQARPKQDPVSMREAVVRHIARASGSDIAGRHRLSRRPKWIRTLFTALLMVIAGAAMMWWFRSAVTTGKTETPHVAASAPAKNHSASPTTREIAPKEVSATSIPAAPARPPE